MDPVLTTSNGAPIGVTEHSLSAESPTGATLLQDFQLLDKLGHFDREILPERRVHARGAGAHGFFEVTADVAKYCKASFLSSVGTKTPVFVRFSTVLGQRGSNDNIRDPRGFSIKHYTKEGNYDMVGLNMPVFFLRDAIKFPDFIHSHNPNPQNNLPSMETAWDFWSLSPESTHQLLMLYSDRGTPMGYRHMDGFSVNTFKWVNAQGKAVWVKLHYKPESGVKNFTATEAASADPDFATKDLFDVLESGEEVAWKAYVQIMSEDEAKACTFDPFDATQIWPHDKYPLLEYGRLVLNRNPVNYHKEIEQAAFSPSHLVPGIEPSPDKVLQGRLFSYPDAQRYRLGSNYQHIPINCPFQAHVSNYQTGGLTFETPETKPEPNYWPNSLHGPAPKGDFRETMQDQTKKKPTAPTTKQQDDFKQASMLYKEIFSHDERQRLITNLCADFALIKRKEVVTRAICNFMRVDKDLGTRLADAMKINLPQIK